MAETVTMPKLGFDMAEGTLVRWAKQQGDSIKKGDVLAEIETDKATLEVDSAYEGCAGTSTGGGGQRCTGGHRNCHNLGCG